jgi:murein DD-endopeptidase MepM/ murein hydrolase activator NlpD
MLFGFLLSQHKKMQFFHIRLLSIILFSLSVSTVSAQQLPKNIFPKKDTINIYKELLRDHSDDLMENHPAEDIYNNIWTSEKLNPYKIPIDSLPDSVKIDCSNFFIPTRGYITSEFGPRRYRYHYGIDLKVEIGDSIAAAFSGKIRIIDYEARGYGHYVVIRHDNGLETVYAHLSQVLVSLEQVVNGGDIIGLGGNTGRSTGPHLHFEIRYLGNAINPASIINFTTGLVFQPTYLITKKKSFYYQRDVKAMQAAKYYNVRKGDTLGHIAIRNGTSVKNLCKLNKINSRTLLRPGQRIRVR